MPDQPSVADLPGVRCVAGDALDKQKTVELCRDADAIYCSIGLPYKRQECSCTAGGFCLATNGECEYCIGFIHGPHT